MMNAGKNIILLAGGTGFIGRVLQKALSAKAEVRVLSRKKEAQAGQYYWNPELKEIDATALEGVTHIINLCGEGIADKRWTAKRKEKLIRSRVNPAIYLKELAAQLPQLKQYISASGVNCYAIENENKRYKEEEAYGTDFVSELVRQWEHQADTLQSNCKVLKLRIGFVLASQGGSLKKFSAPIKSGIGAVLGKGSQPIPWIHLDDLCSWIAYAIEHELEGSYNSIAGNTTNAELTYKIAQRLGKKIYLPKVPAFVLKIMLGQMAVLVLTGIRADNQKMIQSGFQFKKQSLDEALA